MLESKKIFLLAAMAFFLSSLAAQTSSPYSRYGYGMLRDQSVGISKTMGGIGYGLRTNQGANPLNPASYSRIDSLTFMFDMGMSASQMTVKDASASKSDGDGGFDYMTMLFPLKRNLGLSIGILPFSTVGYKFGSKTTENGVATEKTFSGDGGLSQIYLGLGYQVIQGLSIGVNASYLFGSIEYNRSLPYISGGYISTNRDELSISSFKLDLGIQYEKQLSEANTLTLGFAYSPKISSKADYDEYSYLYSSSGSLIRGDTTNLHGLGVDFPESYGFGFTFAHNKKLLVGADVTFQRWNKVEFPDLLGDGLETSERFNNRWKYNLGGEYVIDPFDRNFLKRIRFRGGLNYSNSYLNVKNTSNVVDGFKEYGATLGFGLPIRDREGYGTRTSYFNISFEYKKIKPNSSGFVTQDFIGVSVGVNINELWFFRRKIQ